MSPVPVMTALTAQLDRPLILLSEARLS